MGDTALRSRARSATSFEPVSDIPRPRLPPTRSEQRTVFVFALVLAALFVAELASHYNPAKLSIVLVFVWWIPLLVLHELAHASVARWLGWRVTEIVIGFGRELFRFSVGDTLVRVRVLLLEGYVVPQPDKVEGARIKSALIYLAGPLSEVLLVFGLWLVLRDRLFTRSNEYGMVAVQSLALAATLGALFNLVPFKSGQGVSDGLGAWLSLFSSDESFRVRLCAHSVAHARRALYLEQWATARETLDAALVQYPGDTQLLGLRAVALAGEGDPEAAIAALEALGHPNDQAETLRHELLLDAAWVVLVSADRGLLYEAQQACERALALWSNSLRAHMLLGRVLLERGQPKAAEQHLLHAYRSAADQPEEPQLLALLAIVARELNNADYTNRFLSALDPEKLGPQLRRRALGESRQ
jgi:tetratricopeptide (TPR) repeat protein